MKKIVKLAVFAVLFALLVAPIQSSFADDEDTAPMPKASEKSPGSDYTIRAGDVLQISVWKEDQLDQEVLVLADGSINYPLVGSVNAEGFTPEELQMSIKDKLKKLIPDAAVTVSVKAALGHTVSVLGQVNKPGELLMGHGLTVMQALSQAGGLTPYASTHGIRILHRGPDGKESSSRFPYNDIIDGDDLEKDIQLSPGDVVVVPTAGLL
jgi:polysaccharide biosynthesis/export protein